MSEEKISRKDGFTLVELIVSVALLGVAVLSLGASTASLTGASMTAENRALASQACEDRLARVQLHPIYQELDSLYTESGAEVVGLPDYSRRTEIVRVVREGEREGKFIDFTRVTVTVEGRGLTSPISRTTTIGAS